MCLKALGWQRRLRKLGNRRRTSRGLASEAEQASLERETDKVTRQSPWHWGWCTMG